MENNVIKYSSRTFSEYKDDLINMINQNYPEVFGDFTDSTIGSLLIDLNAGVSNNLSMNIDRAFMETQLTHAQKRSSIIEHAKRLGLNLPGKRPSITLIDLTVQVPAAGNQPNKSYYPILSPGAIIGGGGVSFETQEVIDWSSPVNSLGVQNRSIIPNVRSDGTIVSYNITKRELALNGFSKIYKRVITSSEVRPFLMLTLPDNDVISVENVILLEGDNYTSTPSIDKFFVPYEEGTRYFEVDYLAQQRLFIENQTDKPNKESQWFKSGRWIYIDRKFIKEYTANGFCRLIFGSGDANTKKVFDYMDKDMLNNPYFIENYLLNTALGEKLKKDHTLFVRYRVGGGVESNIGKNVLNNISYANIQVNGSDLKQNQLVRRSLRVNNPIPAVGGKDQLNVEEVRNLIRYNLSSQNRCVTLNDYLLHLFKMPGKFGTPFKSTIYKENNKVIISILNLDSEGKLLNVSNNILKDNILEYLSEYRMVNDFVEIKDGKIYNIAFDIDVFVEDSYDADIANNIINRIKDYFDVRRNEMNTNIFIGKLEEIILKIPRVINIIKIKAYNKVGNEYSSNSMNLDVVNEDTDEITLVNNTIYSSRDSMFEIKYPNKDIRVFLRKQNN